jgi:hypothetical protein
MVFYGIENIAGINGVNGINGILAIQFILDHCFNFTSAHYILTRSLYIYRYNVEIPKYILPNIS